VKALFENLKSDASVHQFLEWFATVSEEEVLELADNTLATRSTSEHGDT
jgi:hypothetical protein